MAIAEVPVERGIRFTTPIRSIVAGAATTMLHQVTAGRTAVIRKIMYNNRNGVGSDLQIGSTNSPVGGIAGAFTQRLPAIDMLATLGDTLTEDQLPAYEFRKYADGATDIVMQATVAAAAPNDVQVMAEIEEFEA